MRGPRARLRAARAASSSPGSPLRPRTAPSRVGPRWDSLLAGRHRLASHRRGSFARAPELLREAAAAGVSWPGPGWGGQGSSAGLLRGSPRSVAGGRAAPGRRRAGPGSACPGELPPSGGTAASSALGAAAAAGSGPGRPVPSGRRSCPERRWPPGPGCARREGGQVRRTTSAHVTAGLVRLVPVRTWL